MAAATVAPVQPQHPGFLLNNPQPQQYPDPAPSVQPTAPVVPRSQPADPYYGHEDTARLCGRFIRHVFNCPADPNPTSIPPNGKPTETTISLPRFIAYAFHRTRLPSSVAFHALFLLSRLKARYPAASCAYGHRLFLTSYMLSSKVICDDTYSNKSWAIVGQGFYELRDVNLMEREMIHYLSFDLTIPGSELEQFTQTVRATYKRGVPKTAYHVIPDKSRENDYFGKGTLEIEMKTTTAPVSKKSVPIEPPPTYSASAAIPVAPIPIPIHTSLSVPALASPEEDSPGADSASSSGSSRSSSPDRLKTPTDDGTIGASNRPNINFKAFRGALGGEPRDVRDPIVAFHVGTDSSYASPSGW